MRTIVVALLLLCVMGQATAEEKLRRVTGRVLDAAGKPVAGAAVGPFWSANGKILDDAGRPIDLTSKEAQRAYWSRMGQMEPLHRATSDGDGRFQTEMPTHSVPLMAIDAEQVRGGLAWIETGGDQSDVCIKLKPLVRVKGRVGGIELGTGPGGAMVIAEVPPVPTQPLVMRRLAMCEAHDGAFLLALPPGRYVLDMYDVGPNRHRLEREIVVTGDAAEIDLGELVLVPALPDINQHIEQSQASGAMGDYTKRYGQPLPEWHVVDARGADAEVRLADFRGKWLLVNFWALNCSVCLKHHLPELMQFYEEHQADRERFEIVAICVDCNGQLQSVAEALCELEPIVQHVWGGRRLPFPVLLDPSMTTLERYGVPGYETLLVDPQGRLVEGGADVLAEKLRGPDHTD